MALQNASLSSVKTNTNAMLLSFTCFVCLCVSVCCRYAGIGEGNTSLTTQLAECVCCVRCQCTSVQFSSVQPNCHCHVTPNLNSSHLCWAFGYLIHGASHVRCWWVFVTLALALALTLAYLHWLWHWNRNWDHGICGFFVSTCIGFGI